MAPFYTKEGDNWARFNPMSKDIRVNDNPNDVAVVFPKEDKEQLGIYLRGDLIARVEGGDVVFPNNHGGEEYVINRRDFTVESIIHPSQRTIVIHSEKPIEGK